MLHDSNANMRRMSAQSGGRQPLRFCQQLITLGIRSARVGQAPQSNQCANGYLIAGWWLYPSTQKSFSLRGSTQVSKSFSDFISSLI